VAVVPGSSSVFNFYLTAGTEERSDGTRAMTTAIWNEDGTPGNPHYRATWPEEDQEFATTLVDMVADTYSNKPRIFMAGYRDAVYGLDAKITCHVVQVLWWEADYNNPALDGDDVPIAAGLCGFIDTGWWTDALAVLVESTTTTHREWVTLVYRRHDGDLDGREFRYDVSGAPAKAVALATRDARVYIVGWVSTMFGVELRAIAYDLPSATPAWVRTYSVTDYHIEPVAATTDDAGNLFITAVRSSVTAPASSSSIVTLRYSKNAGTSPDWVHEWNPGGFAQPAAIAVTRTDAWDSPPATSFSTQSGLSQTAEQYVFITGKRDQGSDSEVATLCYKDDTSSATLRWHALEDAHGMTGDTGVSIFATGAADSLRNEAVCFVLAHVYADTSPTFSLFKIYGYTTEPPSAPGHPKEATWATGLLDGWDDRPAHITAYRHDAQEFRLLVCGTSFDTVSDDDYLFSRFDADRP
jgi:hypothetical protein